MAITNDNFCLTVMEDLASLSGQNNDPLRNREKTGLLDSLNSTLNTGGTEIDQMYDRKDGKEHKVILKYYKPDSVSEVTEEITNICDDTGEDGAYVYDEVALTLEVQSPVKRLGFTQMRQLCEEGATFERAKLIGGMLNAVHKKMNRMLIPAFSAGVGGILNGGGAVNTGYNLLFRDANGQLSVDAEGQINMERDLMDTGLVGTPIIVGGGKFDKFARLKMISCCNNYGVDPSLQSDMAYFYDNDIPTILTGPSGGDSFFVYAPGAAQLVTKPMNQGQFRVVHENELYDVLTDPASGITFDFDKIWDRCTKEWLLKISLRFDLWQLPLDLFKAADDRYAINFNWMFDALETEAA